MMCAAEVVGLMIMFQKIQVMLQAFHINYSLVCPDTKRSETSYSNEVILPAGNVLSLQSTCRIFTGLFIQMYIIPKTCVFNFVSVCIAELHPHV